MQNIRHATIHVKEIKFILTSCLFIFTICSNSIVSDLQSMSMKFQNEIDIVAISNNNG